MSVIMCWTNEKKKFLNAACGIMISGIVDVADDLST